MNIYGYTRINKKRTRPKNLGLKKQATIIKEYATAHDLPLKKILSDSSDTSVSLNLPNLKKIGEMAAQKKIDVLIVARLDRVTRSVRSINSFIQSVCQEHGVKLISIEEGINSGTKSGKLALSMLNILGKWDQKMISDRTKEFIERKRLVGERVGHAPFGFIYENKKLVPYIKELKTVYLIREKRDSEELSYHKIAKFLNETKVMSKRGGRWYAETIKTIYENPIYDDEALKELASF